MTRTPIAGHPLPTLLARNTDPGVVAWREDLPVIVAETLERWQLDPLAPYEPGGSASWVAPVTDREGARWALKVSFAHDEARDEADGMAAWQGHGAARVARAERRGGSSLLLMEEVRPGTPLAQGPPWPRRDEVIAQLARGLWITPPAGHTFRPLTQMCAWWADEAAQRHMMGPTGAGQAVPGPTGSGPTDSADPSAPALPSDLVAHGLDLFRTLPQDWDGESVLLATDLHHENVLDAGAGRWALIDPKPYVGDPHYDLLQHMLNDPARLQADPSAFATRMATLTGLDPERARRWLLARCVQEASLMPGAAQAALQLVRAGVH